MENKFLLFLFSSSSLFVVFEACTKLEPKAPEADSILDAPLDGLTYSQNRLFNAGDEEFDEVYITETGLGPLFVSNSCVSCHSGDNRGHLFTILTRFGQNDTNGNKFMSFGAPQIQNRALPGHAPEQLPDTATSSKFTAPIVAGVGFLELVSDADILSMADPNDANGDGVSGVPNWNKIPDFVVPSPNATTQNGKYICRFGRKASTYNLHQQTVTAFNQDMGITTTYMSQNPFNYKEGLAPVATADPDITDQSVNAVVFYLKTLRTPLQRNQSDAEVINGKTIFIQTGCENCHKQTLQTGYSPVEALSNKTFHPFTDLLLHDMGPALDDHYTEGSAQTFEWRTTPLWGLGLAPSSQGGQYFLMHDGRAHSIEEAIALHGGEAAASVTKFNNLSQGERAALIKFLKSL
ncbi:MAG: c-type cytochrome, partial [Bacteroidia bacterium]|nr:c-type cytochrome [Bacteroidia bacterium]